MSSSGSGDELEETPAFIRVSSPVKTPLRLGNKEGIYKDTPETFSPNKLDLLLSEQEQQEKEEEYIQKTKEELLRHIKDGSQDINNSQLSETMGEDQACHIQQLELKVSRLLPVHPGLTLIEPTQCCRLFNTVIPLDDTCYDPNSSVGFVLSSVKCSPVKLKRLLQSKVLVISVNQLLYPDLLLEWLLYLMSVNISLSQLCYDTFVEILQRKDIDAMSTCLDDNSKNLMADVLHLKRPASILFKIMVNLGASSVLLLGSEHSFSEEEIRKCNKSSSRMSQEFEEKELSVENLSRVLRAFSKYLQSRPSSNSLRKEDLVDMVYILAVIALEASVGIHIQKDIKGTIISVIENIEESDWKLLMPLICKRLWKCSTHHHDQAYLLTLLHQTDRGQQLQGCLAYLCLRSQLAGCQDPSGHLSAATSGTSDAGSYKEPASGDDPISLALPTSSKSLPSEKVFDEELATQDDLLCDNVTSINLTDDQLVSFQLQDIAWLGVAPQGNTTATLTSQILHLIEEDNLYKVASVLRMLDLAVGGDSRRSIRPKDQLEFLFNQVKIIIKNIKDNIFQQDHSKIKDVLSRLKTKWSLTLDKQRTVFEKERKQRSIFAWATSTVNQEHLRNLDSSQTEIDEDVI